METAALICPVCRLPFRDTEEEGLCASCRSGLKDVSAAIDAFVAEATLDDDPIATTYVM